MAEGWWGSGSARTGGDALSACSATPAGSEISGNSGMSSGPAAAGLSDCSAAASPFFLADPQMDWTQPFLAGKVGAGPDAPTSFNALLHLQGDASRQFLLDQAEHPPPVPATPYTDGASHQGSLYGSSLASSYGDTQAAATMKPFSQQHHQFPDFFSSTGLFGTPAPIPRSPQPLLQALEPKLLKASAAPAAQDACSSSSATRKSSAAPPAAKKPRTETPSPMPTFKVRKEKLGDRVTALQQLVSPFGKTDTASVLHEAIGYIRFLHEQVASLSSPYFISGPMHLQHKQGSDDGEAKEDLRSRGLCLVPVASTYTMASDTAPELWHPTFGGTFH
ncbi:hypothetical protein D1007_08108 [Hordeum vulgare]|uniref:Predicted protein n=1 Tax=Hordeum vulgare subsp. vulgare TaxID=112509 RepID=F2DM77_HORVV|nr:transcription factor bHLH111-like isoform X2 [Hordeum vulgare subsp. vulgare]KAE8814589.1 hypothetical protein D1007_08108 [Hordeum vulgare]KAI5018726.1 hypothetical protein ZWY2020_043614 [Hordeum vulgare]BAJ96198.1 predicted protein [Hordeum vulgare subsp. vulgare]BAK01805.1 predicted protein [Hordeum vulgare subsp. vulgare]